MVYPVNAKFWWEVGFLRAAGRMLPAYLKEGRWAPWEHLQSTRIFPLYRRNALVSCVMFSEETLCEEMVDRLHHMPDWEFPIKVQTFAAEIMMASEEHIGRQAPRGGMRPEHMEHNAQESCDSEDDDSMGMMRMVEVNLPAMPSRAVLMRVHAMLTENQS